MLIVAVINAVNGGLRSGVVTVPWQTLVADENPLPTGVKLRPMNGDRTPLPSQVDVLDPDDPSRTCVSIYAKNVEGNGYGYAAPSLWLSVELGDSPGGEGPKVLHQKEEHVKAVPIDLSDGTPKDGIILKNDRLEAFVQLPRGPAGWQAGAVTSVLIFNRDILDAFKAEDGWQDLDPEKRLQVDYVSVPKPPWAEAPAARFAVFDRDWSYVASGQGPVRAFVTIKSPMFTVIHADFGEGEQEKFADETYDDIKYECHLYRSISLHRNADYLLEEMWVRGKNKKHGTMQTMSFAPHFFLKMKVGVPPPLRRQPENDWFAIGATGAPLQGYGFAANWAVGRIENPPADYPNDKPEDKWGAFGWPVGFGRTVRCLHLFKRGLQPEQMADETGRHWFDLIYNPMRAAV
jgi:hypothetical protein